MRPATSLPCIALSLLALHACGGAPAPEVPDQLPEAKALAPASAYALARTAPEHVGVILPQTTRPNGAPAAREFGPHAPFTDAGAKGKAQLFRTPLPASPHLFPSPQAGARSFGNWDPPGFEITYDGKPLKHQRYPGGPMQWGYDMKNLTVALPAGSEVPRPDQVRITWPKATAADDALHVATANLPAEQFALRTLQMGTHSYSGVLVPPPGLVTWKLTVPPKGKLAMRATVIPPAIHDEQASDGASVSVIVDSAKGRTQTEGTALELGAWTEISVDLSQWAGEEITLGVASAAGATAINDHVFLEDPAVYTPSDNPRRLVVAYLDTVRRDHLGMYGHSRPTTPKLDSWAEGAVRLDQTRTVAPWTLPSARSALSGHQPEAWYDVPSLPSLLAEQGFVTEGLVANAYLSQVFDMDRGFGHYSFQILQPAAKTIDEAIEVLDRWPDRDVFLWVQFMEAHLPYMEPMAYQNLFSGPKPSQLSKPSRAELVKWHPKREGFAAVKAYTEGRYDQNLRVLDDEVSRLFDKVGEGSVRMIFSDHGEEFWDHGGFEHGHTFYDELLGVPWVVSAPGLEGGALDHPTSLLDLTPTALSLLGLNPETGGPGVDLTPAMQGDSEARRALLVRPQGFGRPLYGADGWSVLAKGKKWIDRAGAQRAYDMKEDPAEQTNIASKVHLASFPEALQEALGREVPWVWRVVLPGVAGGSEVKLQLTHPAGLKASWLAYDPRSTYVATQPEVSDGMVTLHKLPGPPMPRVFYVQPSDPSAGTAGLEIALSGLAKDGTFTTKAMDLTKQGARPAIVLKPNELPGFQVDIAHVPEPGGTAVSGFHPDVAEQLKTLGYVDEDE